MPAMKDIEAVINAISTFDGLNQGTKNMFEEGLPFAAVKEGKGRTYQIDFLTLAEGVVKEAQEHAAASLSQVEGAVKDAESALRKGHDAKAEAQKAADEASAKVVEVEAVKTAKANIVTEVEAEHRQHEQATSSFLEDLEGRRQQRAEVKAVLETLTTLVEGSLEGDDAKSVAIESVMALLGQMRADKTVCAGAPHALQVTPEERHPFDQIVVDAVVNAIKQRLTGLDTELEAAAAEEEHAKAETLGLWAIADCARDEHVAAKRSLEAAEVEKSEAMMQLTWAQDAAHRAERAVETQVAKRARLQTRVETVAEAFAAAQRLVADDPEPETKEDTPETEEPAVESETQAVETQEQAVETKVKDVDMLSGVAQEGGASELATAGGA